MSTNRPTAVITGGTAGIGFELARGVLRHGFATRITGRHPDRGREALERLQAEFPDADLALHCHDLSEPDQVSLLAGEVEEATRSTGIQLLIHNAGLMTRQRQQNSLGWELMLAANHLAPFELSRRWLPLLRPSPGSSDRPRMLVIASDAHRWVRSIDPDDLHMRRGFSPLRAYARSKLANILFVRELARRLPNDHPLVLASLHPGGVATKIGLDAPRAISLLWRWFGCFLLKPARAAEPLLEVALDPSRSHLRGDYLNKGKPQSPSAAARDDDLAIALWQRSEKLIGHTFTP